MKLYKATGMFFLALFSCLMLSSATASADEEVSVILDWFLNPDHAAIIAAQQIGAFKKEGLDVDLIQPTDASVPPRLVAAGQADLAIGYQSQLYTLADQGVPIVRVATLIDQPLNTLMARGDGGIKSISDLKGKTIGFSVSGVEEAILAKMLKTGGVSLDDVDMVNVNFQLVPSLLSHKADAVIGAYRTFEATEMRENNVAPTIFRVEDYGIPAYDELVVMARSDDASSQKIKSFVAALKEGVSYLKSNTEKSWTEFTKNHPDLNNTLNAEVWKETASMFADDPGYLDVNKYQSFAKFLHEAGITGAEKPISEYAVDLSGS